MGAVCFKPPQQQLGVGAQGRQWIAQLMHEGAQLIVLLAEFLAQLQAFQVSPQGVTDRGSTAPHPLVQGQRPTPSRIQIGAQCSQDQAGILEGIPAPTLVRQAQVRVCVGRGKRSFIGRPLPDQQQGRALLIGWRTDVQPQMLNAFFCD